MRLLELLLALPALYLVIALRSALPLDLAPSQVFIALALVIGLFGWAHLARIVRARVLSLRTLDFVTAARAAARVTHAFSRATSCRNSPATC